MFRLKLKSTRLVSVVLTSVELNARGKRVVGYSARVTMVDATAGADSDAGCVSDYHQKIHPFDDDDDGKVPGIVVGVDRLCHTVGSRRLQLRPSHKQPASGLILKRHKTVFAKIIHYAI